ncbi:MAG TPA: peptidylprolyl isomerase [Galbitalea sp.]
MAPSKNTEREAREARDRLRRYNARQEVHTHQVKRRTRDNLLGLLGLVVVAALATGTQIFYFTSGPGKPVAHASASATPTPTPAAGKNVGNVPPPSVAEDRAWTGTLTLNGVKLGIELDGTKAPQAVASFVTDVKNGYLKDKLCWRLTNSPNFGVLQCGTTSITGADSSNYSFGPLENTPSNNVYPAGELVLARTSDNAYGNGHQFFITWEDTTIPTDSAGGYSVFGKITSGLAELNSTIVSKGIQKPATGATTTTTDGPPVVPTSITSVTIK